MLDFWAVVVYISDMVVIDSHSHTRFSFDSSAEPEAMILAAIEKGIATLCFTEHLDINESNANCDFFGRFDAYFEHMSRLRQRFAGQIDVVIGLEAGYGPFCSKIHQIINKYPFEYIINSIHDNVLDYFLPEIYLSDKQSVYEEYLRIVEKSLDAPYKFDAIGHLGYPSRAATYKDNAWHYADHKKTFDSLLKKIVEKEIILEVNTSVFKSAHPFLPSPEILAKYLQFGGKHITFSSDAHSPASLARKYPETIAALKQIGFAHLTKSKNGKKTLLEI